MNKVALIAVRGWSIAKRLYGFIESSKIALGLLGALLASILIGSRDAYFQREELFRPQRTVLLKECDAFLGKIEIPLVTMTRGYIDYSLDVENVPNSNVGINPVVPIIDVPQDKEEEIKWKIRKEQELVFKVKNETIDQRRQILQLIQNYTVNPRIEVEWCLIDAALNLLPGEDRFVSSLWMAHVALDKNVNSIIKWNAYINTNVAKRGNDKFIEHSPMAFRVYFYQHFIREHLQILIRLILKEQMGNNTLVPPWLILPTKKEIPAITYPKIIETILQEYNSFQVDYLNEVVVGEKGTGGLLGNGVRF